MNSLNLHDRPFHLQRRNYTVMTSQTQKAIVIQAPKVAELVTDRPLPTLRDDYILVETVAVALNPTDWKAIEFRSNSPGALVGCDYAGIVREVGKAVTKPFKKGDRICGFVHGSNDMQHEDGTFAEYIVVKGDLQIRIPDWLSFEEAATLGLGVATVGQGLYQALKLPLPSAPSKEKIPILIYGGSSASGVLGIQFATLSGYAPITTCSPHNFAMLKSLGAAAVFDYKDPDSVAKIREFANNNLKFAWDTISSESSAKFCADALSSTGGKYAALLDIRAPRDDIDSCWTIAYTIFGEQFTWPPASIPAVAEDYEFGKKWGDVVSKLLLDSKIKAHKQRVGKDGLKGVLEGLQLLRENKVSGEKLVYRVGETP
ncbi:chaperonin 10-like protein [Lipomyces tetrasporus]|uniref:Chaperonin 10-like protein n=1 Tax=Lipomyces tetrasporus TaxID=54092 RepID=A0AAD7QZK3_9ASCO|nr:chaperonin 10-like protein [Lipomyces tetrasporus]KAJ8104390.1 chaperonin 10-like protein [Lipomyces tetrasporus]